MRGVYDEILIVVIDENKMRVNAYGKDTIRELTICCFIFAFLLITLIF